jgi:hypothetical protein
MLINLKQFNQLLRSRNVLIKDTNIPEISDQEKA